MKLFQGEKKKKENAKDLLDPASRQKIVPDSLTSALDNPFLRPCAGHTYNLKRKRWKMWVLCLEEA